MKTMCSSSSWSLGVRPHGPCPIQEDCLWPRGSGDHWHPRQNTFQKTLHLRGPQTQTDTGGETQHPFCHQKVGGKDSKRKCMAQGCQGFELCSLHAHRVCFDRKLISPSFIRQLLPPANLWFSSLSVSARMWQSWLCHDDPQALPPCFMCGTKLCQCHLKRLKVVTAPSVTFGGWEWCPGWREEHPYSHRDSHPPCFSLITCAHPLCLVMRIYHLQARHCVQVSAFPLARRSGYIPSNHCAVQSLFASLSGKSAL